MPLRVMILIVFPFLWVVDDVLANVVQVMVEIDPGNVFPNCTPGRGTAKNTLTCVCPDISRALTQDGNDPMNMDWRRWLVSM